MVVSGAYNAGAGTARLALPAWGTSLTSPLSLGSGCSHVSFLLQAVASAAQASLLRQQEELDRKAAELDRKERELQNTVAGLHGKGGRRALGGRPGWTVPSPACSWGSLPFAELAVISEWCWAWRERQGGSAGLHCDTRRCGLFLRSFPALQFFDPAGALALSSLLMGCC